MIWRKGQPPAQHEEGQRGFDDFELRLGDILRGERATLGKSLLDVQRELHIRAAYVAAIENGDVSAFETPSFIAGFVRSYARYLGMDPEWVYGRFCTEHGFQVAHGMSSFANAAPRLARAPRGADFSGGALKGVGILPDPEPFWRRIEPGALGSVSVLLALILGLGYAGWTVLKEVQRVQIAPADVVPNVASDINPLSPMAPSQSLAANDADPLIGAGTAQPTVSRSVDAPPTAEGVMRIARPQALEVPVLVPRDGPIAAIPTPAAADAPMAATDAAVIEALAAAQEPIVPQVVGAGQDSVEILAVRPAWVRVRAADGSVVFERVLDAGERYTIPHTEAPPTLHAGNSGSVYFIVNGQAYGPAAPGAIVVRNVSLAADSVTGAFQVADLSRDQDLAVHVARLRDQ